MAGQLGEDGWQTASRPCKNCGDPTQVVYRVVEASDGGHEDYQYHCQACGVEWWIDGIDS